MYFCIVVWVREQSVNLNSESLHYSHFSLSLGMFRELKQTNVTILFFFFHFALLNFLFGFSVQFFFYLA